MRSLFVDGIFFQHAGAAAAIAQSQDRAVDAEDGVVGLRELEVVVGMVEIGSRIVEGGETERGIDCLHTECFSVLGLEDDERAVFMVAIVLWAGIVGELVGDGALPIAYQGRLLAVGIVLPRPAAIPRE